MTNENAAYLSRFQESFTPNYRPAEIVVERGEGCTLYDVEGRAFLDMVSGIAVSALGHGHPKLVAALQAQAGKVLHTSNLYMNQPSIELAELLCRHSFAEAVYFCNSGAEANEASIKLARRYAHDQGEAERTKIVSFDKSFHGRTFAALTATAQPKYHVGFGPMPQDFVYLTYGDLEAAKAAIDRTCAAVIVEPLQGEGGVRVPPAGFLKGLAEHARSVGALVIFDEVQTGVGRTGKLFCYEHEEVVPDIMSLAKGVGGGMPLGAMVTTKAVGASLAYGTHATTYGGNPMACAAGRVVLEEITTPGFLERVGEVSAQLFEGMRRLASKYETIEEVRGRGLLIGAQVKGAAIEVVRACRERGVLVHVAGPHVVRLAPPLILDSEAAQRALSTLDEAFDATRSS